MGVDKTSPGGDATPPPGPPPVTGNAPGSATPPAATSTLEEALRRIAELEHSMGNAREEVDRHRKKISAYEKADSDRAAAKKAADDAQLTEIEKLKKEHAELQAKYEQESDAAFEQIVVNEIFRSATRAGAVDPDAVVHLIDWELIEVDDDGKLLNLDKLVATLLKDKPYLTGTRSTAPTSGGATNPSRSQTQATTAAEIVAKMRSGMLTKEEYARLPGNVRDEVQTLIRAR